jgi:hypothetical protein
MSKTSARNTASTYSTNSVNWTAGEPRLGKQTWTGWVPVSRLIQIKHNPEERTNTTSKKYKGEEFEKSLLETGGPIQSMTVAGKPNDSKWIVSDGNSRQAVCLKNFGPNFKVLVTLIDCPPEKLFAILNTTGASRLLDPNDKPTLFLLCKEMLGRSDRRNFEKALEVLGVETFNLFANAKKSYHVFKQAKKLAKIAGYQSSNDFISSCLRWLLTWKVSTNCLEQEILRKKSLPPSVLLTAVLTNRPIKGVPTTEKVKRGPGRPKASVVVNVA